MACRVFFNMNTFILEGGKLGNKMWKHCPLVSDFCQCLSLVCVYTSTVQFHGICVHFVQVVLIGDAGVGKTCAVQRFKHGLYIERHGNTIGVDFMLKTVEVDGARIKVCAYINYVESRLWLENQ